MAVSAARPLPEADANCFWLGALMADSDGVASPGFEAASGCVGEAAETTDSGTVSCGVTNRTVTLRTTEALEPPPIGRRRENRSAA